MKFIVILVYSFEELISPSLRPVKVHAIDKQQSSRASFVVMSMRNTIAPITLNLLLVPSQLTTCQYSQVVFSSPKQRLHLANRIENQLKRLGLVLAVFTIFITTLNSLKNRWFPQQPWPVNRYDDASRLMEIGSHDIQSTPLEKRVTALRMFEIF